MENERSDSARTEQAAFEQADRLEQDGREMDDRTGELQERVNETRQQWESKKSDEAVAGAQAPLEEGGDEPSAEREESDQLPEEGPSEQVPEDTPGDARDDAEGAGGGEGDEGQATGNPPEAE